MAAPVLTIVAVNQTSKIRWGTLTVKLNTLDVLLVDPATVPANGDAVTLTNPTWSGTVVSVETTDPVDIDGHVFVKVVATNAVVGSASAGPFGLSNTPNGTTTRGYRDLKVKKTKMLDGSTSILGSCDIEVAGLWPAMTFLLTSTTQGYAAQNFSVVNVTVTWKNSTTPTFHIEFGDPLVTMAVWAAAQSAYAVAGSIPGTSITLGGVDTPQLHANAVTTAKLAAGSISTEILDVGDIHNTLTNPSFEAGDLRGWTAVPDSGGAIYANSQSHGGKWACKIDNAAGAAGLIQSPVGVVPCNAGDTVALTAWYLGSAASVPGYMYLTFCDSADAQITQPSLAITAGSGWLYSTMTAVAPANTASVRCILQNATASKSILFDDVTLSRSGTVIDAKGVAIYNGLLKLTNPSSVVVIDGTSNMFKIQATGTLTVTWPAPGATASNTVTLTALGSAFTTVPVCVNWVSKDNGGTTRADSYDYSVFVAGGNAWSIQGFEDLTAGQIRVNLYCAVATAGVKPATTGGLRYYVMIEAGI